MRFARGIHSAIAVAIAAATAACAGGGDPSEGLGLQVRGGTYRDGSGRAGLAALVTLRDATGAGPASALSATLSDSDGALATVTYPGGGDGSYAAWWWPELAVVDGERYALRVVDEDGSTLDAGFTGAPSDGLPVTQPRLAPDASRIDWEEVPGARSYACRVFAEGATVLDRTAREPGCDVSALPPGGYAAAVLAFSADLPALAESSRRAPSLPARFDVSEARLAFARPDGGAPAVTLQAAGGAFDYGTSTRGFALWLSIGGADGTPTTASWTVTVVGPQISAADPLEFTYHANFPRTMVWSYDVPAVPGAYALSAVSSAGAISTTFTIGDPPALPFVVDATASAGRGGSAVVDWTPVAGARAYLVDVWDSARGESVASQWVPAPPARFAAGTFAAGETYEVYVAATDADMSGATTPSQVAVSEFPYLSTGFVAE